MSLLSLIAEIIFQIIDELDDQSDIYSLVRTCRRLYHVAIDPLYLYDIRSYPARKKALTWAVYHNQPATLKRTLRLAERINDSYPAATLGTALHYAARQGHLTITKILLQFGANPETRDRNGCSPSFKALVSGHEKVALTILLRVNDICSHLVMPTAKISPLHLASRFGMSGLVRFLLVKGVDVEAKDALGRTAQFHASCPSSSKPSYAPSPDAIYKTLWVLRNAGASLDPKAEKLMSSYERKRNASRDLDLDPDLENLDADADQVEVGNVDEDEDQFVDQGVVERLEQYSLFTKDEALMRNRYQDQDTYAGFCADFWFMDPVINFDNAERQVDAGPITFVYAPPLAGQTTKPNPASRKSSRNRPPPETPQIFHAKEGDFPALDDGREIKSPVSGSGSGLLRRSTEMKSYAVASALPPSSQRLRPVFRKPVPVPFKDEDGMRLRKGKRGGRRKWWERVVL